MLHAKDEHMNTPLYYACLCGNFEVVRWLSVQGARDDAYARCYYNALNLSIRRYLKGFNVYSMLLGHRRRKKRAPCLQEIVATEFERHVAKTSSKLRERLIEKEHQDDDDNDNGEKQQQQQQKQQEEEKLGNGDDGSGGRCDSRNNHVNNNNNNNHVNNSGDSDDLLLDDCEQMQTEDHDSSDDPNHDFTIVLYDRRGKRVVREFPCHLFILLSQGRGNMIEKLLFDGGDDTHDGGDVSNESIRSRLHELRRTGRLEIRDERVDAIGLEIFLRYLYTGRLTIPWALQAKHHAEDKIQLLAEIKQWEKNKERQSSASTSEKKRREELKTKYQAKFKGDLLFGNLFPDVAAHQKTKMNSFWNTSQIVLAERFDKRHAPLIESLISTASYFNCYELLDYIQQQLEYRKSMVTWYSRKRREERARMEEKAIREEQLRRIEEEARRERERRTQIVAKREYEERTFAETFVMFPPRTPYPPHPYNEPKVHFLYGKVLHAKRVVQSIFGTRSAPVEQVPTPPPPPVVQVSEPEPEPESKSELEPEPEPTPEHEHEKTEPEHELEHEKTEPEAPVQQLVDVHDTANDQSSNEQQERKQEDEDLKEEKEMNERTKTVEALIQRLRAMRLDEQCVCAHVWDTDPNRLSILDPPQPPAPKIKSEKSTTTTTTMMNTRVHNNRGLVSLKSNRHINYVEEWRKIEIIANHLRAVHLQNLVECIFVEHKEKHGDNLPTRAPPPPLSKMAVALRDIASICVKIEDEDGCELVYGSKALLIWRSDFFRHTLRGSFSDAQDFAREERERIECMDRDYGTPYEPPVLDLYDCSRTIGCHCIRYCLTDDDRVVQPENAIELLMLSARIGPWKNLEDKCIDIIKENITMDNAADVLSLADMLSLSKPVKQECVRCLSRKLKKLTCVYLGQPERAIREMENEMREKGIYTRELLVELFN